MLHLVVKSRLIPPFCLPRHRETLARWAERYFFALLVGLVALEMLVLVRARGWGFSSVSAWFFALGFLVTLWDRRWGLIACVVLLTVGSSMNMQLNELFRVRTKALLYPGVDAIIGFLAASLADHRERRLMVRPAVERGIVALLMVLLHAWIAVSAVISVARNLWQSASELSLKGLVFNLGLVRGISWHDDYYPLQDLFFLSAAILALLATWSLLVRHGAQLAKSLGFAVLAGASLNGAFAVWQKLTGLGWLHYPTSLSLNAFFPDLHSFAAMMAVGIMLAIGLLATAVQSNAGRAAVLIGFACCGAGLFLSNSRSTLLLVLGSLVFLCFKALYARKETGARVLAVGGILAAILALHAILLHDYRGLSYASLQAALGTSDFEQLGVVLSHRPEIWASAVRMYTHTPFFGLGQGTFYRMSSIPEFSGSRFLAQSGGENAHNYFLQTAVELGPVAWGLTAAIALATLRAGRGTGASYALFGLAGVVLGNVFAHALLIREMLVISMVLLAMHLWHVDRGIVAASSGAVTSPLGRRIAIIFVALALAAVADAATSIREPPFNYGKLCHEQRGLWEDGWTGGLHFSSVPAGARRGDLHFEWSRPDAARRGLHLDVSILAADGVVLEEVRVDAADAAPKVVAFRLDFTRLSGRPATVVLKTSSCFTPLNNGLGYDPRRLGVRIRSLDYYDDRGVALASAG